ncbi:MAG: tetratricopeptide repeat protein, partial [Rhodospirillales bacterium]
RLDQLFARLKAAPSAREAQAIEHNIWRLWTHAGIEKVDAEMAVGTLALAVGEYKAAFKSFDAVVKMAPDFAEGWNKRATVEYLLGDFDASVGDIERTLTLEPRHFGALSGLGLIYLAIGKERAAIRVFEGALAIHPHLPGAKARIKRLRSKLEGEET